MKPSLSVLIPAYNSEKTIIRCINSILSQSYKNIEIIVINDGSTDATKNILEKLNYENIKIINNESNLGISRSLNRGLDQCNSDYIARMDADDVSTFDRFTKQIDYLEKHQNIDVLGCYQLAVGGYNNGPIRTKINDDEIKSKLLVGPTMLHPTVVFRGRFIYDNKIRYDPNCYLSEDYELWTRISPIAQFSNLPEILYEYNWDSQKNWEQNNPKLMESLSFIWNREISRNGIKPTKRTLHIHMILSNRVQEIKIYDILSLFIYINRLIINNFLRGNINSKVFIFDRYNEYYLILRKFARNVIYGNS